MRVHAKPWNGQSKMEPAVTPKASLFLLDSEYLCKGVIAMCRNDLSAFLFRRFSNDLHFVPSIAAQEMILLGEQGNGWGVTLGPPAAVPVAFASWHPATPPAYNTCQHEYG